MTQVYENNDNSPAQLAIEFIEQLKVELPLEIARLRKEAGALAAKSVVAASQGHPVLAPQPLHEGMKYRSQALGVSGEASGMTKLQSKLFGLHGIHKENFTIQQCMEALSAQVKILSEDMASNVDSLMLKALRYSEMHPDYGTHMATAIEAHNEVEGVRRAYTFASELAQKIEVKAKAKSN